MALDNMHYSTSGIICLAGDLRTNALYLQQKRQVVGDAVKTINDIEQAASDLAFYPELPAVTWYASSRLIILGHGDDASTYIIGTGIQWDAKELARQVERWLNLSKIKRISLHMCFGGGNRGAAVDTDADKFVVHPSRSFAYRFASHCSLAETVTARTEEVRMTRLRGELDVVTDITREVGGRHKGDGDKVVFTPQGGTLEEPVNPTMRFQ
jgi:hypothetical protein